MQKRWTLLPSVPSDSTEGGATANNLSSLLNVSPVIANLLINRNITTYDEAKQYFRPSITALHDPYLMKDMDKAVERVEKALSEGEKILIYGDYDVDGTTSVALVYSFLSTSFPGLSEYLGYYIPDRYSEGYGISVTGIDFAKENGYSLIIALDCGIKSNDKVKYALKKNIDFIICDHHLPGEELPKATAVLDPKRSDCFYPYKELSGCGIGFKLIHALSQKYNIPFEQVISYCDLVAISIGADIVPMTGENRMITYFGLKELNENPRIGIRKLIESSLGEERKKTITVSDVVFIIAPRINAAGRIEHGSQAVELLLATQEESAEKACSVLNEHNIQRKGLDKEITAQALQIIDSDEALKNAKTTVLYHEDWHKGVIGIVASRLIEKYYRPTILLTRSNGMATGSARSVRDYNVHDAIEACSHLLLQFGGHKYAAGLTLKIENILPFAEAFEKYVSSTIPDHLLIPEIVIDAQINFSDISDKFFRILQQFAPFGPQNMKPVFVTRNVIDAGFSKKVGLEGEHLKLDIIQKGGEKNRMSAIAFNMGYMFTSIVSGAPFSIVYKIDENEWNGNKTIKLKVEDMRMEG